MYQTADKIKDLPALLLEVASWRVMQDTIVFSNGCFDLLHLGHVDYLERAAALGDRLIIGLNSDVSVRSIKGADRPVQDQESRVRLLAAMEFVDAVVLFDQDTPAELIGQLLPDVLVKGKDYAAEEVVGYAAVTANGGRVETVDLVEGYSSSAIMDLIRGQR